MQKGFRAVAVITFAFLVVGMALLPASGQPGQWRAISPVFTPNLNDVSFISPTSGWAVGDSPGGVLPGIAIHWDGTQWQQILTPALGAAYSLESVACLAANNCLAVGTGAGPILLQWDGISWIDRSALVSILGTTALHSIFVRSDGLGFAVGESPLTKPNIIRVNYSVSPPSPPAVTSEASVGAPDRLRSVMILPPGTPGSIQGFAVGDNGAAVGAAWRWDGTPGGWLASPPGAVATLRGVQILNPNEAVAVGDADGRTRWNGASWTPEGGVVIATANWRSVFAVASNDEWIVGSAVGAVASIAHWNGVAWTAFLPPNVPAAVNLNSVQMLSSSDGWAVGQGGTIIRWDGSSWKSIASPVASPNSLRSVWLASSADGWAVGDAAPPALSQIFRWDGATWDLYQTSPVASQLNAIHGTDTTNVFAVGNSPGAGSPPAIVRWTGGPAWTNISPAGVAINLNLYGVFTVNPSLAFAVGQSGTMLRWDGTLWASILSGAGLNTLRGIWMVSGTDGWAVGDAGTIVRWNGLAWAAETSPTPNQLNGVQALTSTDVWAVGNSGTILHRNGLGWTLVPSGVTQNLNSLYMLSDTEGWAVGASDGTAPVILFWDGSTWTRVFPIPVVNLDLLDIWMVASQDGWSVGQNGLILRFGPGGVITGTTTATTTITVPVTATSTTTQSVTATTTATTSTAFTQVTTTQTVTGTTTVMLTSTTITITPVPSPIPGFPIESILAGLVAGIVVLFMLHKRRRT